MNFQRYVETYFSVYPGYYCTGDGALRDKDGYYQVLILSSDWSLEQNTVR